MQISVGLSVYEYEEYVRIHSSTYVYVTVRTYSNSTYVCALLRGSYTRFCSNIKNAPSSQSKHFVFEHLPQKSTARRNQPCTKRQSTYVLIRARQRKAMERVGESQHFVENLRLAFFWCLFFVRMRQVRALTGTWYVLFITCCFCSNHKKNNTQLLRRRASM